MTKCNYTQFTNRQLIEQVLSLGGNLMWCVKKLSLPENIGLWNEVVFRTSFLESNIELSARLYCLEHDITERPMCESCGKKPVSWLRRKRRFSRYCCPRCREDNPETQLKREATCQEVYGGKSSLCNADVREKGKQTCIDRYGVESSLQAESVKEKIRATNMERRGVPYPMMDSSVREKSQQTWIKKLGVDNPQKSIAIKQKTEQTCNERYGSKNPFQSIELRHKAQQTLRKNYGVDYPLQSDELLERARKTNMSKRGVMWHTQSIEYHKTAHKRYTNPKYPDLMFASSWEFIVYDFLTEHNIEFEYQPSIVFEYEYDGKKHTYHPDFKVGDDIYEVKGDQFFRINENGEEEMCAPAYDKHYLTDEEYEYKCLGVQAKYRCMIEHDVKIIRKNDIRNLGSVFGKYYCNSNTRIIK